MREQLLAELLGSVWSIDADGAGVLRRMMHALAAGRQEEASLLAAGLAVDHGADRAVVADVGTGAGVAQGGVMVISIRGVIRPRASFLEQLFGIGGGIDTMQRQFRDALASEAITGIVFDIDSPGGTVIGVAEFAEEIRAARGIKPIVAVANGVAMSAAFWLAAQADKFFVTPSGATGSVGALSMHQDFSGFEDQIGIKTTLIPSRPLKIEGHPFAPLEDEARAQIEARVKVFDAMFVKALAAGRGVSPKVASAAFGDGRPVLAKDAVAAGMADDVLSFDAALAKLAKPARARRGAMALDPRRFDFA